MTDRKGGCVEEDEGERYIEMEKEREIYIERDI